MSAILGILQVSDTEAVLLSHLGEQLVFDAINEALGYHNADVAAATAVFVKGNTEKYKDRWLAPGDGMMMPATELAPGPAVQRYGEWDCGYPLRGFEESIGTSRRGLGYMTTLELNAHLDTIAERNIARHRQRMLIALFENTNNTTFTDPIGHGTLTIVRLANTDGVTYPALPGATAEAEDQHYGECAYGITEITDTNNPIVRLRNEVVEHFGGRSPAGENVLFLHNADATAYIEALTDYDPIGDKFVDYGADTDLARMIAGFPGRLHGRCNGCFVSEWAWIPATYALAVHLDYPPLKRRVDTAASGLGTGLQMVARDRDHPLESSYFADWFGYGVFNRLSAAILEISDEAGAEAYAPPAAYVE